MGALPLIILAIICIAFALTYDTWSRTGKFNKLYEPLTKAILKFME